MAIIEKKNENKIDNNELEVIDLTLSSSEDDEDFKNECNSSSNCSNSSSNESNSSSNCSGSRNDSNKSSSNSSFIENIISDNSSKNTKCLFEPPLNISGNLLGPRHLRILQSPCAWFNDDIINAFFCKLRKNHKNCHVFSSFMYASLLERGEEYCMKHWVKDLKAFLCDENNQERDRISLIPINSGGSHWVLVAWYIDKGTLKYFDSLMCKRTGHRTMKTLSEFLNSFISEYNNNKNAAYFKNKTGIEDEDDQLQQAFKSLSISSDHLNLRTGHSILVFINSHLIPAGQAQQTDASSCGPFCCWFGKLILTGEDQDVAVVVDIYSFRRDLIRFFLN